MTTVLDQLETYRAFAESMKREAEKFIADGKAEFASSKSPDYAAGYEEGAKQVTQVFTGALLLHFASKRR